MTYGVGEIYWDIMLFDVIKHSQLHHAVAKESHGSPIPTCVIASACVETAAACCSSTGVGGCGVAGAAAVAVAAATADTVAVAGAGWFVTTCNTANAFGMHVLSHCMYITLHLYTYTWSLMQSLTVFTSMHS